MKVPILSVVIGEGGSGGALALAVADEVWMLEHSVYSILSPEGFASILWKDSKKAKEAAAVMKLTAADLYQMGMIEHVIPEAEPVSRENIMISQVIWKTELRIFLRNMAKKSRRSFWNIAMNVSGKCRSNKCSDFVARKVKIQWKKCHIYVTMAS